MYRTRSTLDRAELPSNRYPSWNDSRRETFKIPTVQGFPKGLTLSYNESDYKKAHMFLKNDQGSSFFGNF
jgi:hypothetical protein